jgi:hypothetical protein
MSKFLILWENVPGTMPTDPKERVVMLGKLMEMVKQRLNSGETKDWGVFAGENAGYSIVEGTAQDLAKASLQFAPYIKFTVHPVLSLKEVGEVMKSMMK